MRLPISHATLLSYAGFLSALVFLKIFFLLVPTTFPLRSQTTAFSWGVIASVAGLGAVGLICTRFARFPEFWDQRISNLNRIAIPTTEGAIYGAITIFRDLASPVNVHLGFPLSIPFYTFGAIFLEILLRLFGLTVSTFLLWKLFLRGKWHNAAFWISNVAVSLYEPLPFIKQDLATATHLAVPGILVNWAFQPLFLGNVLTGYMYKRYGFIAAIVIRLAFYAVWHVAYGGFRSFWLSL
jgi:hypothetical protein